MINKTTQKRLVNQWDVLKRLSEENRELKKKLFMSAAEKRQAVVQQAGIISSPINKVKADIKADGCCLCGYKKCAGAIDFHHVETKTNTISSITNLADLITEFTENKVVALCAICHREIHHGFINPDLSGKEIDIEGFLRHGTKRTDVDGKKRWVK